MLKISTTSKLDGIRSWSLQARETCPGSVGADGALVPACAGCYATDGNYRFPSVAATRAHNREDWQRPGWVKDFVEALRNDRFFRWFDSGDMYSLPLARKILAIMKATPWVKHWLPTRVYKFQKFAAVLAEMRALPNVMVRASSDEVDGSYTPGVHGSCIVPAVSAVPAGAQLCHAATNAGKCGSCRACYDKAVPVIAYLAHGRAAQKVIRIQTATREAAFA